MTDLARARRLLGDPLAALVTTIASFALSFASTGLKIDQLGRPTLNGDRFFYYGLNRGNLDGWYLTNDQLGYPYGQDLRRFPIFDQTHLLVMKVLGLGSDNTIVVTNAYYLLGFPLAGLAAYAFLRVVGVRAWMAVPLGVSYAILPWHAERAQHLFLASYWVVPLGLALVYLVASGTWDAWLPTLSDRRRKLVTVGGCVTGILVALGGIYYALMLSALMLLALALRGWRSRAWRGPSMWLVGFLVGTTFTALVIAHFAESAATGPDDSGSGFARAASGGERFSGRLAHLLLPWTKAPLVGRGRATYDANTPLFLPDTASFSIVAAAGTWLLLGIAAALLLSRVRAQAELKQVRETPHTAALAWLAGTTVILVLVYTATGIGAIVSNVAPELRGWSRYAIFIAITSTAAVGLVLQEVLARLRWQPLAVTATTVVLLSGLVVADEAQEVKVLGAPALNARVEASRVAIAEVDRAITPTSCAAAQWPHRAYPESPPVGALRPYDEEITYIAGWDRPLSYGGVKGSIAGDWPGLLDQTSAEHLVSQLASADFCVLEVLEDAVTSAPQKAIKADLTAVLGAPVSTDRVNHRAYYDLRGIRSRLDALGPEAVEAIRDGTLEPVQATFDEDTSRPTGTPGSGSPTNVLVPETTLRVTNSSDRRRSVTLTLRVSTPGGTGTAFVADRTVAIAKEPVDVVLTLDLGPHETRRFPVRDAKRADGRGLTLTFAEPQLVYDRGPLLEP